MPRVEVLGVEVSKYVREGIEAYVRASSARTSERGASA